MSAAALACFSSSRWGLRPCSASLGVRPTVLPTYGLAGAFRLLGLPSPPAPLLFTGASSDWSKPYGANLCFGWKADVGSVRDGATGTTYLQSVSLLKKRDGATRLAPTYICPSRLHIPHCATWQSHSQDRQIAPSDSRRWTRPDAQDFPLHLLAVGDWHAEVEN